MNRKYGNRTNSQKQAKSTRFWKDKVPGVPFPSEFKRTIFRTEPVHRTQSNQVCKSCRNFKNLALGCVLAFG
jgi:hypothetical protein